MKWQGTGGALKLRSPMLCGSLVALLALGAGAGAQAQTMNQVVGAIDAMTVLDSNDTFSAGTITVSGQLMIIPRNLLIDAPAARFTLSQAFGFAPDNILGTGCLTVGQSGLAAADTCPEAVTSTATVLANRQPDGTIIVGDLFIDKGNAESITGIVTAIDHTQGYLRVNGVLNDVNSGTMVRINDPERRHSIQSGDGCRPVVNQDTTLPSAPGNCSPDTRFGLDPDNYTITFITGYPACIPSTVTRSGPLGSSTGGSLTGQGDALCPDSNRDGSGVANDSTLFAPILVGDHISADGSFENIGDASIGFTRFFTAHTLTVNTPLTTKDSPDQPDYMIFDEVEWDVPGFQNERARALLIGFTTLATADVKIYKLNFNSETGGYDESIFGSTVGCDNAAGLGTCTVQGIAPNDNGIFKLRYDVDFLIVALGGTIKPRWSPCAHLNADPTVTQADSGCTDAATLEDDFQLMSPAPREIIGRSSHKGELLSTVKTIDMVGNEGTNGEYLTPVGQGHPEFAEINLGAIATAFIFEGQPWNLDRRAGPGGSDCDVNGCETAEIGSFPLDPFPCSGLDPRYQVTGTGNMDRLLAYAPLALGGLMPLESIAAAQGCNLVNAAGVATGPAPNTTGGTTPTVDPSDVQVGRVQFEADKGEWRIDGTTSVNFETLTIYVGDPADGIVVGQTAADDIGVFSMRVKDSDVGATSNFVTVVSDNTGGSDTGTITLK